jgi:hypothetical protein
MDDRFPRRSKPSLSRVTEPWVRRRLIRDLLLAVALVRRHPVRGLGHPHRVGIAFARKGEPGALLVRGHCRDVARRIRKPGHHGRPPHLDPVAQGTTGRPRARQMIWRGCPRDETANRTNRATQALVMPWSRQRQASLQRPLPRTTCRKVRVRTGLVPLVLTIQIALNGPS